MAILNLSTVLLRYPKADPSALLGSISARLIGIDLHWMVHVQGSLAVARLLKTVHPDTPIVFGGISSTFYAGELVQYPYVDMVMKGYDTHEPLLRLLEELGHQRRFETVPNLTWKRGTETVDKWLGARSRQLLLRHRLEYGSRREGRRGPGVALASVDTSNPANSRHFKPRHFRR